MFTQKPESRLRPVESFNMVEKHSDVDYDVVIVGAGISGISFGYRLQERNPHLKYCILDARHEIGGTWSLFQYPGRLTQQYLLKPAS